MNALLDRLKVNGKRGGDSPAASVQTESEAANFAAESASDVSSEEDAWLEETQQGDSAPSQKSMTYTYPPGSTPLPRYTIRRGIGMGGFGEVYYAKSDAGKEVALKRIPVSDTDCETIQAFLPMLLVPGIMGDFLSVMPKVVSVALLGSVLVDHLLIPAIAARWYRKHGINLVRQHTMVNAVGLMDANGNFNIPHGGSSNVTVVSRLRGQYFEVFDENWKGGEDPAEVEKHWGLFRADRSPKAAMAAASQPAR